MAIDIKEKGYKHTNGDDIIEWCKENNEVEWLKEAVAADEEGNRPSFLSVKLNFFRKYFPEIAPKSNKKKPMYQIVDEL